MLRGFHVVVIIETIDQPTTRAISAVAELLVLYKGNMSQTRDQKRSTISEVAADWHELMIPWRIMRPCMIVRASEQLDQRCRTQTYHRSNQPH